MGNIFERKTAVRGDLRSNLKPMRNLHEPWKQFFLDRIGEMVNSGLDNKPNENISRGIAPRPSHSSLQSDTIKLQKTPK